MHNYRTLVVGAAFMALGLSACTASGTAYQDLDTAMSADERFIVFGSAAVALLAAWAFVAIRVRRRRRERIAQAHELDLWTKAEIEKRNQAAASNMDRMFGRESLWRRELAQNELDRYYGVRSADVPDPTFEEWCAGKGILLNEEPTDSLDSVDTGQPMV